MILSYTRNFWIKEGFRLCDRVDDTGNLKTENYECFSNRFGPEHTLLNGKKRTYHLAESTIAEQAF